MKWYQKTWATILFLFLFSPLGIFFLWKYRNWNKLVKTLFTCFFGLIFIVAIFPNSKPTKQPTTAIASAEISKPPETETQIPAETTIPTETPTPIETPNSTPTSDTPLSNNNPSETLGQKNALKTAKAYLSYTSFSYTGLIKQLEYEKYSSEDAKYAADNCGADWNEQAAKMAKSYLDYSSFSRDSLITQLEYEGFTNAQAVYGAESSGY